jgi:tetratricopeptide (TPR) repeat protein
MPSRFLPRPRLLVLAVVLLIAVAVASYLVWRHFTALPQPGSKRYEEYVSAFNVGTAALDVDKRDDDTIEANLTRAVELVPQEPAGWINRAIWYLRTNQADKAAADLDRAARLVSDNAEVEMLRGYLAEHRGNVNEAIGFLRKAVEHAPRDVRKLYKLSELYRAEFTTEGDSARQRTLERILAVQPDNLYVLGERAELALRRQDAAALNDSLARWRKLAPGWRDSTQKQFVKLENAVTDARSMLRIRQALAALGVVSPGSPAPVLPQLAIGVRVTAADPFGLAGGRPSPALSGAVREFVNLLTATEPAFRASAQAVKPSNVLVGDPLHRFLKLQEPQTTPSAPDVEVAFTAEPLTLPPNAKPAASRGWETVLPVWLTRNDLPVVFLADGKSLLRADGSGKPLVFPGGPRAVAPSPHGVVPVDWLNRFRTDFVLAGAGGVRFYEQQPDGSFADVTAKTKLPTSVLLGNYFGAWAVDVDMDGDLDIVLGPREGPPILLRNNFDGTFTHLPIFPGVDGARAFAWGDFDNDGAPDAALLDRKGALHLFANERSGRFRKWPAPESSQPFLTLTVADVNDDGVLDLVALRSDGALLRISDKDKGQGWDVAELARWDGVPARAEPGSHRLFAADLDNNGALDLLASGPNGGAAWLADGKGDFAKLAAAVPGRVAAVLDLNGDGRLDLLGFDDKGRLVRYLNRGAKDYHWQEVKPRARYAEKDLGDNRVNTFGLGAEVELRAGTLVCKQMVTSPVVHFGLGQRERSDVISVVWTNGARQAEFSRPADSEIVMEQRLTGSCPFVFTWDGERMVFVADFLWSTPLGMYINAQDKGGFLQTTDWVKIRGDRLKPRDGYYDIRVQANLWETHFIDHLSLIVVDHPPDTEVFVDERFFLTPTEPQVYLTAPPKSVARARDHRGADVTDIVRWVDGRYLDTSGRGTYQGVTRDHWVEVDLGAEAPRNGPLWLVAHGWLHPTDSSINFALEQGGNDRPRGLVLEVPDGKGGWKVGRDKLGFPAGKNKTILIRLDGIDGTGVSRRFRLRTNMEIYWDALHYAKGLDAGRCGKQKLSPRTADLRYKGFLAMTRANASSPEVPHYDRVASRRQIWRDLVGYHTRFGDVRELLEKVDDRYVIMNAGDEIRLRFDAPPGPPAGWKRDFVWVSDGWVKDGNLNTRWGKTVLPLPSHGMQSYDRPPGELESDPVYRRFPEDWRRYHTRFVTPSEFERGLRPSRLEGR